ncbi:hypothetical protein TgHK011_007042 [Trichoderma gracile]|nr:hypothetical protein TgHK011_007042 [Trichoderma gracile]
MVPQPLYCLSRPELEHEVSVKDEPSHKAGVHTLLGPAWCYDISSPMQIAVGDWGGQEKSEAKGVVNEAVN